MTRFFYTDPLAAAWMAKHFGMKFVNGGKRIPPVTYSFLHNDLSGCRLKYTIHPDSLWLLEPILSDAVEVVDATGFYLTKRLHDVYDKQQIGCEWRLHRIIQRAGKSFHWPESETTKE